MPTPPQSGPDGHGLSLRGKTGCQRPRDGRTVGEGERGRLQPEEGLGTQTPPLSEPRPHQAGAPAWDRATTSVRPCLIAASSEKPSRRGEGGCPHNTQRTVQGPPHPDQPSPQAHGSHHQEPPGGRMGSPEPDRGSRVTRGRPSLARLGRGQRRCAVQARGWGPNSEQGAQLEGLGAGPLQEQVLGPAGHHLTCQTRPQHCSSLSCGLERMSPPLSAQPAVGQARPWAAPAGGGRGHTEGLAGARHTCAQVSHARRPLPAVTRAGLGAG